MTTQICSVDIMQRLHSSSTLLLPFTAKVQLKYFKIQKHNSMSISVNVIFIAPFSLKKLKA